MTTAESTTATIAGQGESLEEPNVWRLLEARATRTPNQVMLVDERGRRITFAELLADASAVAAGLHAHGVRAGDVVTWQLPTGFEAVVTMLALARIGVVQSPLVMMLREREIGFITTQLGTDWFVTCEEFRGFMHGSLARSLSDPGKLERVFVTDAGLPRAEPGLLPPYADPEPGQAGWVFYTSGTTADPKGARHTDVGLLAASATFCEHLALGPEDRTATLLPLAHVGGVMHVLSALRTGSRIITSEIFDPWATTDLLTREAVTILGSGVPFLQSYLSRQRKQPEVPLFPQARVALCGGSGRPPSLHAEVRDELGGVGIVSGYGMTECPYLTWGTIEDTDEQHALTEGRAGHGAEIRVLREDGTLAPPGEPGEIRVRGPQLMLGYVDRSLDPDAFDPDGFFRSGDLGYLDTAGYLTVTGRLKDVIIRKMENISARELEELIISHPEVAEVAVIGLPDEQTGERVCAVLVPTDTAALPSLPDLCTFLSDHGLSTRKLPEQLELVEALPRNAMGKILKRDLVARFTSGAPQ